MKTMRLLCIILAVLALSGCQYDPYADNMTTTQPKIADVVGTYRFEQQTVVGDSIDSKARHAVIRLNADGTVAFSNVPHFSDQFEAHFVGFISAKGKWKTNIVGTVAKINGDKDEWGIALTQVPEDLTSIGLMGDEPPYKLLITYGDPDEGSVMIFSKIK